ncbi:bifunctional ADP-dependent NAD(P)H-hydrate dehydratase/NAD(P)H-hydrate epimerase [Brevibacterium daeguense]|uniref:Bifunctional NAD(P)H-hydrate repair enzyme n=1 Tax=Brevibacterium daeguense TaxID=909936 RepID=A0ABP8EG50_9MICO|nr:NAD(P)H-hydrate dehydratase [Brevibacterium daeguense]
MKLGYTADAVRAAEQPLLDAGQLDPLMRTAAAGLARVCRELLTGHHGQIAGRRVVVLAGSGKNGGDALFAGADLASRGAAVTAVDVFSRPFAAGVSALRAAGGEVEPLGPAALAALRAADLVIDGVFGTGAKPGLPEALSSLITDWQAASGTGSRADQLVVAVDVPTGVDASTGTTGEVSVRADHTVTFGAHKAGLLLPGGAEAAGEITLIDIGLDFEDVIPAVEAPEPADLVDLWPLPQPHMHKYSRGVLGLVAGSQRYPGAGVLAAAGAVSAGLGMLRLLAPATVEAAVLERHPETVTEPGRVQAWALGPGAPDSLEMRRALVDAENRSLPVVIDAAGLRLITRPLETSTIVTPHAGELVGLLGRLTTGGPDRAAVEAQPVTHAVRAAEALGAVVVLKGNRTVIARPDGTVVAPPPGPANLATAGTGDVLTGILGALLATTAGDLAEAHRIDLARLAGLAVLLHGLAGRHTTHASGLPAVIEELVLELGERRP